MNADITRADIRFVLFDLAGTTVRDGPPGDSLVVRALDGGLREAGATIPEAVLAAERGRDHEHAIRDLLQVWRPVPAVTGAEVTGLCARLNRRLLEQAGAMTEVPGAAATFRFLHQRGIRVGVGSGAPRELIDAFVAGVGWLAQGLLDYVESTATIGAGRPDPGMIRDVMARFGIADPRQVLKVGDTVVDVAEGRNAGAWTVSVLTGTQGRAALAAAAPEFILDSVADLPPLYAQR
ncbi:MAG: HAD family hydrolase [Gemmatimonadetes bacterium]|nr:HAD family hydrolase [Gemmatimonadota bacterium]